MPPKTDLPKIYNVIDCDREKFLEDIKEAVAIPSVSACPIMRHEVSKMVLWLEERFRKAGATTERVAVGTSVAKALPAGSGEGPSGPSGTATPALLVYAQSKVARRTVCVYLHADTRCPAPKDGDLEEPFNLRQDGDWLIGCGVYDNKGPLLSWLHTLEAFQATGTPLPVNVRLVIDGLGALGSPGLSQLLFARRNTFLGDVDYLCVTHGSWLQPEEPCLVYGTRGVCVFEMEIHAADKDAQSGAHSGALAEPMVDAALLIASMVDSQGRVKIEGIREDVIAVTPEEERIYRAISFNVDKYMSDLGTKALLHKGDKSRVLMHRWRFPALSVHCIEPVVKEGEGSGGNGGEGLAALHAATRGSPAGAGATGLIPGKIRARFSLRIVPNMTVDRTIKIVNAHIDKAWRELKSVNKLKVTTTLTAEPWLADPRSPHFQAASRAVKNSCKRDANLVREGSAVPGALILRDVCQKPLLLLPLGYRPDETAGAPEVLNVRDYTAAPKILAAYLTEVATLPAQSL